MTFDFSSVEAREPGRNGVNAEFYAHARGGTLHLQQCASCGHLQHPPRYRCRQCTSPELRWVPDDGVGTLYTWTTTQFAFDRGWVAALPYRTGVAELASGVRVLGALDDEVDLRLGMPVRTVVVDRGQGMPMVAIVPLADGSPKESDGAKGHTSPG